MLVSMVDNKKEVQKVKAYSDAQGNRQYLVLVGCPICKKTHAFFAGQVGEKYEDWCKEVTPPCDPSARFHVEWNGKFYSGMEESLAKGGRIQKPYQPVQRPPKYTTFDIRDCSKDKRR